MENPMPKDATTPKTRDQMAFSECTRDPIFLFQTADIVFLHDKMEDNGFEYDGDAECIVNKNAAPVMADGYETFPTVTDEELIDHECAIRKWRTEFVFYSREEGEQYGHRRKYKYGSEGTGWRVYCVCAEGELARVLDAHDDSRAHLRKDKPSETAVQETPQV